MAAPRSELQIWIKRERKLPRPDFPKGWPIEELSRRMFALGYTEAKPGTIQIWEAPKGRDPGAENIEGLEKVFGSKAPGQKETGPSTMGEAGVLAAALERAIDRQTEMFRDLLLELRSFRLEQVEYLKGLAELARREGPGADPEPEPRGHVEQRVRQA